MKMVLVALILASVICGCETIAWPGQSQSTVPAIEPLEDSDSTSGTPLMDSGLPASTAQRFDDIPLPSGLKEDMDRTYVYQSSTIKIGRMVYTAREDVQDLAQFFLSKLPEFGWKLDSLQQAEKVEMLFTKPEKHLAVSVIRQGIGRANVLILHLTPTDGGSVAG